ncbi:RagB/SusD family nutrient uptake outer membrane protein [Maribacter sp. PR1]|uniref:RagB/SusD family nutrient uptake outer membrane protein n=1 Tax=Maribacter cobaltidurans TaxID=1178778 RepID=A0ABU7IW30_9FLAO|nr:MULTISPECIES: RagB/SusD family nutrient uptake outer membrane protein [Maribacter]MDC6389809.1 RagB/SusD family nutrient uptake outer membrane protein [Maribacter sp. PR1]MEE1977199.1 RagB/SusD family nutrient uptake outer membrane protein [Maribacter cobaltidurans]
MKTFKLKTPSLLLGAMLMATMSCSDEFLEVAPTDSLADAQVSTQAGIDGLLIGTYSALNGVFGNRFEGPNHWATGSVVGGEANKGTDAGDYSSLNPIQRYEASPVDPNNDFNNLWRGRYEGISRANKVLSAIANSTELSAANAARLAGEARLLRGHFYFDLKKHFNNIVVFDETVPSPEIALLPNNGDAWAIIESDFQYAYDNLPAVNGAGRVNKWAAAAYMGKAKLFQQKFGEAKSWFDDVIANGVTSDGQKYALLDDYAQIFNAENDNHAEAVFDVESANNTGSVNNANWFDDLNYPYNTGADGPGNCCGFFQPSFEMANSYRTSAEGLPLLDGSYNDPANVVANDYGIEADEPFTEDAGPLDPRIDHVIGRRGIPYLDWIEHPGKAWIRSQPYGGPYSPKKYIYYRSQENSFTDGSSWTRGYATMNYTIIRFADVLLMAAEAEIEAGSLDKALEYVNLVRARAANSEHWVKEYDSDDNAANYVISEYTSFPNADFARQAVRFERKLELGEEGHRFFDLVRWGVAADELNAYLDYESTLLVTKFGGASFTAGKNEFFPIPQAQIDQSEEGVLTQNPGY